MAERGREGEKKSSRERRRPCKSQNDLNRLAQLSPQLLPVPSGKLAVPQVNERQVRRRRERRRERGPPLLRNVGRRQGAGEGEAAKGEAEGVEEGGDGGKREGGGGEELEREEAVAAGGGSVGGGFPGIGEGRGGGGGGGGGGGRGEGEKAGTEVEKAGRSQEVGGRGLEREVENVCAGGDAVEELVVGSARSSD